MRNAADSHGWEARRVLTRRFDPLRAGDATAGHSQIYEKRSKLPSVIQSSTSEMTEGPLLEHFVQNKTKFRHCDAVENRQISEPVATDVDAFVKGKHSKE